MRTVQELNTHAGRMLNVLGPVIMALPDAVDDCKPFTDLMNRSRQMLEGARLLRLEGLEYVSLALVTASIRLSLSSLVKAGDLLTGDDTLLRSLISSAMVDDSLSESMGILNDEFAAV